MPLTTVTGDPLLTRAQILAFGHNAKARSESGALATLLMQRYPTAFAAYRKQCRAGRIGPGDYWLCMETVPRLAFLIVRETAVGATRYRHVQSVALKLARDYRLLGIESLAIAPLARSDEWAALLPLWSQWFARTALPVTLYAAYAPGVEAEPE